MEETEVWYLAKYHTFHLQRQQKRQRGELGGDGDGDGDGEPRLAKPHPPSDRLYYTFLWRLNERSDAQTAAGASEAQKNAPQSQWPELSHPRPRRPGNKAEFPLTD